MISTLIGHWGLVIGPFLPAVFQPVGQEGVQLVDGIDFLHCPLDRIGDPAEFHNLFVQQNIARPRIAIPRLPDAARVHERPAPAELQDRAVATFLRAATSVGRQPQPMPSHAQTTTAPAP